MNPNALTEPGIAAAPPPPAAAPEPPQQTAIELAAALTAGDHHAAASHFARDACFLTPDSTSVRGRAQIHRILAQMTAMRFAVRVTPLNTLVVGDVALCSARWQTRLDGAEGSRLAQASAGLSVLKRIDGSWKLMVAAPWGWG
jgi:uncharacterized protein (TIGR02246 family)